MNPALGMNVCLLHCVTSCDCLALPSFPKQSTARVKLDSDMSDRDDQGLNEAVAERTADVLYRAGRLSKGPCRLFWKASATEKTEAYWHCNARKKCWTDGRGLQSFHHPWQEPQRFSYIQFRRTRLESGCSTNKNCCHRSSVLSLVSILRIKVCSFPVSGEVTRIIFRFLVPSHHIAFRFMVPLQHVVFQFMMSETRACRTYV